MSIETFTFAEIQQEMLIPPSFVPRIVADLARGGLIVTFPGRDGDLQLARPPAQINLLDEKCPVRRRWARLQGTITNELESITFEDLAKDASTIETQARSGS